MIPNLQPGEASTSTTVVGTNNNHINRSEGAIIGVFISFKIINESLNRLIFGAIVYV